MSSDDADSCELCGKESGNLRETTVAGARLQVCKECARHSDSGEKSKSTTSGGNSRNSETNRRKRAAQNIAKISDAQKGDSKHWEEKGTHYQDDPLPYLVSGYGKKLEEARQDAGLQPGELAGELGVDEADILAIEQGRANRAGIGGSLITDIEERLNVQLSE